MEVKTSSGTERKRHGRNQIRQTDSNADKDADKRDNNAYLQTVGKHLKSQ